MNFKYKVGEKVRVLDGSEADHYAAGWVVSMNPYVGKTLEVMCQEADFGSPVYKLVGGGCWHYDERYLAPAKSNRIVIYTDKKDPSKVIAKDISTGKTGVAKCSPEDIFDFYTGAKLAMERLTGMSEENITSSGFKIGDYVIGLDDSPYLVTATDTIWKVIHPNESTKSAEIRVYSPGNNCHYNVSPKYFKRVNASELGNYSVVCVKDAPDKSWGVGKIYKLKNGVCRNKNEFFRGYFTTPEQMSKATGATFIKVME